MPEAEHSIYHESNIPRREVWFTPQADKFLGNRPSGKSVRIFEMILDKCWKAQMYFTEHPGSLLSWNSLSRYPWFPPHSYLLKGRGFAAAVHLPFAGPFAVLEIQRNPHDLCKKR